MVKETSRPIKEKRFFLDIFFSVGKKCKVPLSMRVKKISFAYKSVMPIRPNQVKIAVHGYSCYELQFSFFW